MIQRFLLSQWGRVVPWNDDDLIEQDLVLSRLIVEIANDPNLGDELVFRGGTCLHKLHLAPGRRYSEDLDYVHRNDGGIGPLLDALRRIGERLEMEVRVDLSKYPKVTYRAPFESGSEKKMRIKIEMNTYERSPAFPLVRLPHEVRSEWFTGSADVQTFALPELVATKLRATYQRRKGRDLFDLWLALTTLQVPPDEILTGFAPYRPERYTSTLAVENLLAKVDDHGFRTDLDELGAQRVGYDIDEAAALVIEALLRHV